MKKPKPITSKDVEDWVKDFQQLAESATATDGFLTVNEIAVATGMNREQVGRKLKIAYDKGVLEAERQPRMCIDGVLRKRPAYRIKK